MMGGAFTDNMVAELAETLVQTESILFGPGTETNGCDREAALWATTIASRFAQTSEQLEFTRNYATRLARSLGCNNKDQLVEILGRFAWAGPAWDSTVLDLIANLQ